MLQDKQAKEEERQKERRWAFLHGLERKGVTFVAGISDKFPDLEATAR